MTNQSWFAVTALGFLISPMMGLIMIGLYLFNYSTAIIFGCWSKYHRRGCK